MVSADAPEEPGLSPGDPEGGEAAATGAGPELSEAGLAAEFHAQTAQIRWHKLQTHYARGAVVWVAPELNLVDVAVQLRADNKRQFEVWIAGGQLCAVSDDRGRELYASNPLVWAVVAPPWVLVQGSD